MNDPWLIVHGGALGDLVLTIQLGLSLARREREGDGAPGRAADALTIASRTSLRGLQDATPPIRHVSAESLGLHWLYLANDRPPPPALAELVHGRPVLSALGPRAHPAQQRLLRLRPAQLLAFDPQPPETQDAVMHITDVWRRRLREPNSPPPDAAPPEDCVQPSESLRQRGRRLLAEAGVLASNGPGTAIILLHVGSGGRRKRWPLDAFLQTARRLLARGLRPALRAGPAELEDAELRRALVDQRHASRDAPAPTVECDDNEVLAALLSAADAFLGNDAGPTHLAALLGTPTLALFGPSRAAVWRPLGARVCVLQGDASRDAVSWGIEPCEVAGRLSELLVSRRSPPA